MLPFFLRFVGGLATILAIFSFFEMVILSLQGTLLPWGFLRPLAQLVLFTALSWYLSPRQIRRRMQDDP